MNTICRDRPRSDAELRALIDGAVRRMPASARADAQTSESRRAAGRSRVAVAVTVTALVVSTTAAATALARAASASRRCEVVRYSIDPTHAPPGAERAVQTAVRRIEAESGVPFRRAQSGIVRIAWVKPDHSTAFTEDPELIGWATAQWQDGHLAEATVDLRADVTSHWERVLLHELGHVAGLSHSPDPGSLMFHKLRDAPQTFTAPDRTALRAFGDRLGCSAVARQPENGAGT